MERYEIMNKSAKRNMGIISVLPMLAYVAWLIQFVYLHTIYPDIRTSAILSDNFDSTLLFFTLCFVLTSAVLVYFVVHVAKSKLMNPQAKLSWILFMTFAAPVAFIAFWFAEIRTEPERLPVHADIA
ncbi:MAG: hypothetical protein JNL72_09450 [Flavipsychrobacter sp.]|nr:hypothetical protein [Flavipsychrobacter sp.]